jgi:glycosyltransferase involved in cell wall biosynthesis
VDDGSDDNTPAVLSACAAGDHRIHSIHTYPRGIVAALRTAASQARGELLARMDADDIAKPRRFELQLAYLDANPDVAACGTRVRYIPRHLVRGGARRYERWINDVVLPDEIERDLFVECPIPHPSLVVRTAAFERVGGYRDAEWPEDYDLVLRLWQEGHHLGKVPEVLLEWREGDERLSRTDPRYGEEAFRRCKVHYLKHRGAGPVGKAFARALKAAGQDVIAFVDLDPRKIGETIHAAPVIHPSNVGQYRSAYVVAAVGSPEARAEIRAGLAAAGFREPQGCCAVA